MQPGVGLITPVARRLILVRILHCGRRGCRNGRRALGTIQEMSRLGTWALAASFSDEGRLHAAARTRDIAMPFSHSRALGTGSPTHPDRPTKHGRTVGPRSLARSLREMSPATLDQLDVVSLLDRLDTKFLLST